MIAPCRLNDIRQINDEVFTELGVRKNVEMHGNFALNTGWLIQSGQNVAPSVIQRSNPNNPILTEDARVSSVDHHGGGSFSVRSLDR